MSIAAVLMTEGACRTSLWVVPVTNTTVIRAGIEAINETYRTKEIGPWRRHVEKSCDPEIVLEAGEAFTEGEWRGHEGAVGFVANQMDVLEGMWLRLDELTEPNPNCFV